MILVAGNIATGKSTLARKIAERLDLFLIEEDVEGNDFIEQFYTEMERWSLHSQLHFILSRAERLKLASERGERFVIDRSPSEDFHIFARSLVSSGKMLSQEYDLLRKVYSHLRYLEDKISICVYLYDDTNNILERIRQRNNHYEIKVTSEYIDRINRLYDQWRSVGYFHNIIDINTGSVDFRDETLFQREVLTKIERFVDE